MADVPYSKHPLYQGLPQLDFGEDFSQDLTPAERGHAFLSKWLEKVRPFSLYSQRFNGSEDTSRMLRDIRRMYETFVCEQGWSELKYVIVLDHILLAGKPIYRPVFLAYSRAYDRGRLGEKSSSRLRPSSRVKSLRGR